MSAWRAVRVWVTGLLLVPTVVVTSAFMDPAAADQETVGTSEEAWYRPEPAVCPAAPGACPETPVPTPSSYPEHTLHVGVTSGQETARTYLTFDLSELPSSADIAGGTLHLPVAGSDAGTVAPETAELRACTVEEPISSSESGAFAAAPTVNCGVSATATFVPSPDDAGAAQFTVDLARFVDRWSNGTATLAIVPAVAALAPPTTWHVAFHGREREGDDVAPITAEFEFTASRSPVTPTRGTPTVSAPASTGVPSRGVVRPAPLPSLAPSELGTGLRAPEPAETATVSLPSATRTVIAPAFDRERGFAYTAVFYLPLLVIVVGTYLGWGLTRRISPSQARRR